MENQQEKQISQENAEEAPEIQEKPYVERPSWQVWLARIGLVALVAVLIAYYLNIARGGI